MKKLPVSAPVSISALIATTSAHGAIIYNNNGFSVNELSSYEWDIDGDSTAEAHFWGSSFSTLIGTTTTYTITTTFGGTYTTTTYTSFSSTWRYVSVLSNANNFGLLTSANNVIALNQGAAIDGNANFAGDRYLLSSSAFAEVSGFTSGEAGYMGFTFQQGGETRYGWAQVTFDTGAMEVSIHNWAYDDSGNAVQAGLVPEPAETAMGLGALALGAAGLRRWRKNRKTA